MNIRVVRVKAGNRLYYSLRTENEGVEVEITDFDTHAQAVVIGKRIKTWSVTHGPVAASLIAAQFMIEKLASRIAHAGDELGKTNYATKSHMRGWARRIADISANSLASLRSEVEIAESDEADGFLMQVEGYLRAEPSLLILKTNWKFDNHVVRKMVAEGKTTQSKLNELWEIFFNRVKESKP